MKKWILAMIVGLLPVAALADFDCSTKVNNVLVYGDGNVNVVFAIRNDYTVVCNLLTPRSGVDTQVCTMWTALLLSARKNNSNVALYYTGAGSCQTLPIYSNSPAPLYVGESN